MMIPEAIQVLECVDGYDKSKNNSHEVKKIQTVHQFQNGPSLNDLLLSDDIEDLPILVFSIAGKTRGGKSFLLNLIIQYLEYKEKGGSGDWIKGEVPNCFTWKNGIESVTRGLWICPKIFRIKDAFDTEVGVLLMDMEGLYDGEATDGEIIAISGISAAVSYVQMFNMKEKISGDYLESVIRNLIKGIEELNSEMKEELKNDFRLLFVVRDWIGEDSFPYGTKGGKEYISSERERGTTQYKLLWETIHRTFQEVGCVLLPDPGRQVLKSDFNNSGDLSLLDKEFLNQVKLFVEELFKPDSLYPPSTRMTGQDIYSILTSIDGKIADEDLSFMNIFTDHANMIKVEKWKDSFRVTLAEVTCNGLEDAKLEMIDILQKANRTLVGKSKNTYFEDLTKALEGAFNQKVIDIFSMEYENSFQTENSVTVQHSGIWPRVKRTFYKYVCGNHATRQQAYLTLIKKSAAHYYRLLKEYQKNCFKHICSVKKTLEECAGLVELKIKLFEECEDFLSDENNKEEVSALWMKEYQSLKNEMTNLLLQQIENITGIKIDVLKRLRRDQYEYYESFTLLNKDGYNLDCIPKKKSVMITKKVGYGMFGPPELVINASRQSQQQRSTSASASSATADRSGTNPTEAVVTDASTQATAATIVKEIQEDKLSGYSEEQESNIEPVVKKICSLSTGDDVKFTCIFVVYDLNKKTVRTPIFRVKTNEGFIYVDSNCRQYTEWNDFLLSNTLPDVVFCYPLNGHYVKTEGFSVAFATTPASKTTSKILKAGDVTGKCAVGVSGCASGALIVGVSPAIAPVALGVAVVGGVVGGGYGLARGMLKMWDKNIHGEPITIKDIFNVSLDGLAVVGSVGMAVVRTATVAAETAAAVITGARVALGLTALTSLTSFFFSDDTSQLISLIEEVGNSSLKILFYFGTSCSKDAVNVIRKSLKLDENKTTVETLLALLENNCIQHTVGNDTDVKLEPCVSQNIASLVTSILTTISSDVQEVVLGYFELKLIFDQYLREEITEFKMVEKLDVIMGNLYLKLQDEVIFSQKHLTNCLCHNIEELEENADFFQMLLDKSEDDSELVITFRYLIWSLISGMRKANDFFDKIDHEPVYLKDHYLSDVKCHPLSEISQLVKGVVEQTESAVDIKSADTTVLNNFVSKVLKLLEQNHKENWTVFELTQCLTKITEKVTSDLKVILSQHKEYGFSDREKITCDDLDVFTKEIGMEGCNYGHWVSMKVLNELHIHTADIEHKALQRKEAKEKGLSVTPAWSGVLDDLYYYNSKTFVDSSKQCLIKEFENIQEENNYYNVFKCGNFTIWTPCDLDIPEAGFNSYVVYSVESNRREQGFIWIYKNVQASTPQHARPTNPDEENQTSLEVAETFLF